MISMSRQGQNVSSKIKKMVQVPSGRYVLPLDISQKNIGFSENIGLDSEINPIIFSHPIFCFTLYIFHP